MRGLLSPLWRAVHALGARWLEPEERALYGPRLFGGAARLCGAVAAQAALRPEMAAAALSLRARQERAQQFLLLREHFGQLERLCADSYLFEQAGALGEAEALIKRLKEEARGPEIADVLILWHRRIDQKRQAGLRARTPRPTRSTALRAERRALQAALQGLWQRASG